MSDDSNFKGMSHVADVLQAVLKNSKSPLSEQFIRWRLWNSWPDVMGTAIARQTLPVGYHEGILYVWVKNSSQMQDLIFLVKPVREKINQFAIRCGWPESSGPWAHQVRFTLDRKSVPKLQESPEGLREFLAKQSPNEDGEPQRGR